MAYLHDQLLIVGVNKSQSLEVFDYHKGETKQAIIFPEVDGACQNLIPLVDICNQKPGQPLSIPELASECHHFIYQGKKGLYVLEV